MALQEVSKKQINIFVEFYGKIIVVSILVVQYGKVSVIIFFQFLPSQSLSEQVKFDD